MTVYVYAITAAGHPLRLDDLVGVGDPPAALRTVAGGGLAAVVSDAPEGLRPKRRDLAAHQGVQERLMSDGAVLPLQFGLTAEDDDAVVRVLEEQAPAYRRRLEALEGAAEYHLKSAWDEDALLREILRQSPQARSLNEEIRGGNPDPQLPMALGESIAQEVQARQEALAARVVERLRAHAREERSSAPTGEDFLNVSFLVDSGEREQFVTELRQLADELGQDVELRLRGPLPAYSFV
jgi:hypothetical protein